jgi:hypothetical protein
MQLNSSEQEEADIEVLLAADSELGNVPKQQTLKLDSAVMP